VIRLRCWICFARCGIALLSVSEHCEREHSEVLKVWGELYSPKPKPKPAEVKKFKRGWYEVKPET
jgi:hypothetical protein